MVTATKTKTNGKARANGNGSKPIARPEIDFPELRGELNANCETITDMDTRYGVPAPIGALVQTGEGEAIVIGGTDQIAIVKDKKGRQFCERWGALTVQVSGPAFDVTANGESIHDEPCSVYAKLTGDRRLHDMSMTLRRLVIEVHGIKAHDDSGLKPTDYTTLAEVLDRASALASRIDDNRLAVMRDTLSMVARRRNDERDGL